MKQDKGARRRQLAEKISFFARTPEDTERITLEAMQKLKANTREKAQQVKLYGTLLQNNLEDWTHEGYIKAEEQFDRWDIGLCDDSHWVFLKSKDIANRWFERFYLEHRKLLELISKGSSLVHDARATGHEPVSGYAERALVEEIIRNDLCLCDARILKLHHAGVDIEEISDLEGLSRQTAQRRLNRAQARAREAALRRSGPAGLTPKPPARLALIPPTTAQHHRRRLTP